MANISAPRDNNRVPVLIGTSSTDGITPVTIYADPTTHRLLTDLAGGSGTVTSVSVATANGFAGTVATQTSTPVITVSTTVTGILRGNGTAVLAATPAVDYVAPGAVTTSGLTMTSARVLGRTTASTGAIEEFTMTGSGNVVMSTSPTLVTPALGTPSALVGTNITGTAAGLTAGNVTTNANLTGPITSTGNATAIASQTGSGTTFAMSTSPVFVTPTLGAALATSINGLGITSTSGTVTITNAKTFSVSNTLTLAGTDGTTMTFPTTSATIARTDAANTFTGVQTMTSPVINTSLELGHATENTLTAASGVLSIEGVVIPTVSSTNTLTNKRITKRVQSVSNAATITPNADSDDCVDITAIAQAFTIANPSGSPTNFQPLIIRIKDNGTARAITMGASYVAGGVALPTTTVLSKILNLGFQYNTANSLNKWQLIASSQEA